MPKEGKQKWEENQLCGYFMGKLAILPTSKYLRKENLKRDNEYLSIEEQNNAKRKKTILKLKLITDNIIVSVGCVKTELKQLII